MALKHLPAIAERLLAHGRSASEPVAIVSKAATPEQRVLETVLGDAAKAADAAALEPPALVVIGEVVSLRAGLDWLGALEGRQLVADPLGKKRRQEAG
jgi:uroporphyrin-III C-methyltransferase